MSAPVLVLGCIPRIVTAIARSLHQHGIAVDVADDVAVPIPSRAIRNRVRLPNANTAPAEFVARLRGFITQHGHDMLIPADDFALAAMIEHYNDFKDMVQIACPPPDITRLVLNKASTLEIARKCGVRVPSTVVVSNSAQLLEFAESIPFPWVLKPAEKKKYAEEIKSCTIATVDEVIRMYPAPSIFEPPMLLQEFCAGIGVGVEMLMYRGDCLAVFQHRRLKELPYHGGFAVTAVAEAPDPALVQSSLALLRGLQWDGVAMVEFKVNPADGQAVLMEVNGRYWGTLSLPVFAGMNFPLYQWKLAHGEAPEIATTYRAGTRWRWTAGYIMRLHWILITARNVPAARTALTETVRQLPQDFAVSVHDAMFENSDPLAAITELLRALKYLLRYDLKAVFGRFA